MECPDCVIVGKLDYGSSRFVRQKHTTGNLPMPHKVIDHLAALIHEVTGLPVETIQPGSSIDNELEMKSIDFMRIHVALEEDFDVELDALIILELNTLEAICGYVEECIQHKPQPPSRN